MNAFDLKGKTFLVTGASSGIGREIAITLSQYGASVIVTARNEERLQKTIDALGDSCVQYFVGDLTKELFLETLAKDVSIVNGVIHSAGVLSMKPLKIAELSHFEEMARTNCFAPIQLTRLLLSKKKITTPGSVLFISSVNGVATAVKGFAAYAASKSALNSVVKVLALEYAAKKIRFNTIAPGMIKTEMYEAMLKEVSAESIAADKLKYPLGDYGDASDVAHAAVYLSSDAAKWVTGTTLIVDGGLTIA